MKTKELLCLLYETSINLLDIIEDLSIENHMLDSQEYLNWKDSLNSASLDINRI